jgi:uncharacterized alkaline shock family protein YloU
MGSVNGAADDGGDPDGEVRINHSVVVNIIRLSVLEVKGVASVGGNFWGNVTEFFSRKDAERGVAVREDECGRYVIAVRVIVYFGIPLTKVAADIQHNIARQIAFMTQKEVAKVDVIIDGVRVRDELQGKSSVLERED